MSWGGLCSHGDAKLSIEAGYRTWIQHPGWNLSDDRRERCLTAAKLWISGRYAQGVTFAKCELFPTAAIRVECGERQERALCAYVRYPTSHEVTSEQN